MIAPTLSLLPRVRKPRRFALPILGLVLGLLLAAAVPLTALAQDATTTAPTSGTVDVVRLNVRSSPSMSGSVLGSLSQDATVTITAKSDDGDWYKIEAGGLTGWVFADYVKTGPKPADAKVNPPAPAAEQTSSLPTATPAATSTAVPATPAPAGSGAPAASVVPTRINVRSGPGTNYTIVTSANGGSALPIVGVNTGSSWYQVKIDGQTDPGWVMASLTTLAGSLDGVPTVEAPPVPIAPAAAPAALAPAGAPVAAPNTSTGFGWGVTANMWQGDKQGSANLIKELGFGWVKQQVRWEYAEPSPGAINWQEMDDIVSVMNGNGINVMFSIVTSPLWARPKLGGTGGPPEDFQTYANFVGAVAGRYCGRLQAIEVWNEQNLRREWEGFPLQPSSYMDLLKRSYNAIKGACPQMLVISGATTPAGYSDVAFDDIDYLRGMYQNGLKQYCDGVGIHPSGFANPPSIHFEDWQSGNYTAESHVNHRSFYFLSTLEQSRKVMEEFGDTGKRLWPTEFGWGSTPSPFPGYEYEARISEATQAQWTVDAFNIMRGSGYVAVPMLWNLNYPRDTEMGAFTIAGRPVFDALKRLMGR